MAPGRLDGGSRSVLVSVRSPAGIAAVAERVALLAPDLDRVVLVHAVDRGAAWRAVGMSGLPAEELVREAVADGTRLLDATRDRLPAGLPVATRLLVEAARPARQLLALLREEPSCRIVVYEVPGRRRRRVPWAGDEGAWLGRRASVPVVPVRAGVPTGDGAMVP